MTEATWRERLESHARACRGEDGTRLSGANFREANLSGADLSGANFREADLRWADLRWANIPQVVYIGPVGSRHDVLMLHIPDMMYRAGCWKGTREDLLARLDEVYPSGEHRAGYLAAIAALEAMAKAKKEAR